MIGGSEVLVLIKNILGEDCEIDCESPLIGGGSLLDSMGLVQLCIALEERSRDDGFSFDWTSEKAMSSLNSIFRTPESLAQEYSRQAAEFGL